MSLFTLALFVTPIFAGSYPVAQSWSGSNFFSQSAWQFVNTPDNTTQGNVTFVPYSTAQQLDMVYVNAAGRAVISVDNQTTVEYGDSRNSIKLRSVESFGIGSVFVMDAVHLPYGCSVWGSYWTDGLIWPNDGEIDIFEGVNLQTSNLYTLHTANNSQCELPYDTVQIGEVQGGNTNCSTIYKFQPEGCEVNVDNAPASFGQPFAQAGGGVYAAEMSEDGVFIWFFSRNEIPAGLSNSSTTVDTSTWGTPAANFSLTCDMRQNFGFQNVVLDITLCGDWAGAPNVYDVTCGSSAPGACYSANVVGDGSNYQEAYFEINYVKVFSTNVSTATASASPSFIGISPSQMPSQSAVLALASASSVAGPIAEVTATVTAKSMASVFDLPSILLSLLLALAAATLYV